ncbi:PR-1-like protein [Pluteus cervinus]|uniref:PR-1-like protein n=1 Tax=Pluteus cervinus TaxID=181527 RepID=A0ACD3BFN9_9AGAR|nr:PR-1-like protein [Pluteus cervinus]
MPPFLAPVASSPRKSYVQHHRCQQLTWRHRATPIANLVPTQSFVALPSSSAYTPPPAPVTSSVVTSSSTSSTPVVTSTSQAPPPPPSPTPPAPQFVAEPVAPPPQDAAPPPPAPPPSQDSGNQGNQDQNQNQNQGDQGGQADQGSQGNTIIAASGTSSSDISAYLDAHNSIRSQHGAAPLTWSEDASGKAQVWANRCDFEHSGGALGPLGENLAAGTGPNYDIATAIKSWTDEVSEYDPNDPQASHFTQVVWKGTTSVGCAVQSCDGIFDPQFGKARFYVCEYSPPGNVIGQFADNVQV